MALPYNVGVNGEALNTLGFEANDQFNGVGLLTFGFLWPVNAIWNPCGYGITTNWAACGATITTSWTTCGAAPSTTWTPCS